MEKAQLLDLPAELLHHIFHYCDAVTILCRISSVCKRLRAVAHEYNRIQLKFKSRYSTQPFHSVVPSSVTSLDITFSCIDTKETKIQYIIAEILRFPQFPQLRHLILHCYYDFQLKQFLKSVKHMQPILLEIDIDSKGQPSVETCSLILPMIQHPKLQKLKWTKLNYKVEMMLWPHDCNLVYLEMNSCLYSQYSIILQRLSNLETFRLNKILMDNMKMFDMKLNSRLTCLIIEDCVLSTEDLLLLLSKTPALRHLKLGFQSMKLDSIMVISDWEQFIRTHLNFLITFQFYICYDFSLNDIVSLDVLIVPFQNSFWLEEKHWFVACEYLFSRYRSKENKILLYTVPKFFNVRHNYNDFHGILFKQNNYYITNYERGILIDNIRCDVNIFSSTMYRNLIYLI